jgi:hypothetical protein
VSRLQLQVDETLKGVPQPAVWVDMEGGTLDGLTLTVSSLPLIQPGERAVFFLEATNTPAYKDVYKDGSRIFSVHNTGAATDPINNRGGGSFSYRVCDAGTATCSNTASVSF